MTRVLIADDHSVVRAGYAKYLELEPGVTRVGEAADGEEALMKLRDGWDLILLDIRMPKCDGLEVLKFIRANYPKLRTLVTSGLPEDQYARICMKAGANGYISKASGVVELRKALSQVLAGKFYVSDRLARIVKADSGKDRGRAIHACLSKRELQIFCKLASGASVSGIAVQLALSVKTVSTYRTRLMEKLQFKSNADITSYGLRNRLIS